MLLIEETDIEFESCTCFTEEEKLLIDTSSGHRGTVIYVQEKLK
jgi:hypothetical protein